MEKGDYYEVVQKANVSIWANENQGARVLLGNVMERFNMLDQALISYIEAIILFKKQDPDNQGLGELYFGMARCASKLQSHRVIMDKKRDSTGQAGNRCRVSKKVCSCRLY